MERNLIKKPNNVFTKFTCGICLDMFDADEYVYEITYGDGLACYNCIKDSETQIIKRIAEKIAYLKRSREILLK